MKHTKLTSEDYCLYLRKSRADLEMEAKGEGETLARHKRHLLAMAKRMKINITHIYSELESGDRISERPEMIKLIADVEEGKWKGVLVMEVERLARGDTMDQGLVAQAFKRSATLIVTPNKTYDPNNEFDEEYFEFGLFMARREYKAITRRMQRGRSASASEGNYIGARPPYGYRFAYNDRMERYLEIDEEQANVVKMIFDWYINGIIDENGEHIDMGATKISMKLIDLEIPTYKKTTEWNFNVILQMLRNEVYTGRIQWNKRIKKKNSEGKYVTRNQLKEDWIDVKGKHEPLIDIETFNLTAVKLRDNLINPLKSGYKIINPLAGLIFCGKCGFSMILKAFAKIRKDKGHSIICNNRNCDCRSSNFVYVEDRVLTSVEKWISHNKITAGKTTKKPDFSTSVIEQTVKQFKTELSQLEEQKGSLFDLLERKVYNEETFLERSQNLSQRLQDTMTKIDKAEKELNIKKLQAGIRKDWIPTVERALAKYKKSNDQQEKNKLMKSIISKIEYTKEKTEHGEQFQIEIFFREV